MTVSSMREVVADGLAFPECLRWRQGRLWFSDMHTGAVHSLTPGGKLSTVARIDGAPSGLGWNADGDLLVVSMQERLLLRVRDGEIAVAADLSGFTPHRLNDMVVAGDGRAYIGCFGFDAHAGEERRPTVVLCVEPDGAYRVAADDLSMPNGMVITADGGTLIVGETFARRMTAFTRQADGSLSDRRLWAAIETKALPDGCCIDSENAVWVASPSTRECLRLVEGGAVADRVSTGDRRAYACVLGGHDGHTLFIATSSHQLEEQTRRHRSGRIETVRVPVPALR